jgi:hypothetical protein
LWALEEIALLSGIKVPALSRYWEELIAAYASDEVYWFFPKGGTADTAEFREKFRQFQNFEDALWSPVTQAEIATAFRTATLSRAKGRTALPRMLKRVFENLGLCRIEDYAPILVTPVGRAFLAESSQSGRSKILDRQVWRYRLPNPVNSSEATRGICLFPHAFLVEVLLSCDEQITGEEFVLFVARTRNESQLPATIAHIINWRKLSSDVRIEVIRRLKGTKYNTIQANHDYSMAFHHCDLLLERSHTGLYAPRTRIEELKYRLVSAAV